MSDSFSKKCIKCGKEPPSKIFVEVYPNRNAGKKQFWCIGCIQNPNNV